MQYKKKYSLLGAFTLAISLSVLGGCTKVNPKFEDSLNNALIAKNDAFQSCYEQTLSRNPKTEGEMELKLMFAPKNRQVESASVGTSQIKDRKMKKCVANAASGIQTTELPGARVAGMYTLDFSLKVDTPLSEERL